MKYMKYSPFLVLLAMGVFSLGFASFADAHPHVTIELMETHSHDLYASEDFMVHTYDYVILFIQQIQSIILG